MKPRIDRSADVSSLATDLVALCGTSETLHIGVCPHGLVQALVAQGMSVHSAPTVADAEALNRRFQTVVCTDGLNCTDHDKTVGALSQLRRVTERYLYAVADIGSLGRSEVAGACGDRAVLESLCFRAGFRRHPLMLSVIPYESLEVEEGPIALWLETVPDDALAEYPIDVLATQRDVHMDMLRESGRRSDAHIARYQLASECVRAGDVVLDAACGLGYGSAVIAQAEPNARVVGLDASPFACRYATANFTPERSNLTFERADVSEMTRFPPASVDVVVSFETIEHVSRPDLFLAEVQRVLKPGGHFLCSVSNGWVDETGRDPDPRHLHAFELTEFLSLCRRFFAVDAVFSQNAGGGLKSADAQRRLVLEPAEAMADTQAEWRIVSCTRAAAAGTARKGSRQRPVVILTAIPDHPIYSSWVPASGLPIEVHSPVSVAWEPPDDTGVLVTHLTYNEPGATWIRKAVERDIPTLVLADGILEYRNTWEHPQLVAGAIFQPILGHKLACIGRSQARVVESWGNQGKCEIVGMPRLDRYGSITRRRRRDDEAWHVLIMTAKTPYFTEDQHRFVVQSLRDMKEYLDEVPVIDGFPTVVTWRLTGDLAAEIGVDSQISDLTGVELSQCLQQVDAVITTPSTAMLEAMMLGLPVAVLDYCNVPPYVDAAWRITAGCHIAPVVAGLRRPSSPRLLYQDAQLHDALECASPARPRMVALVSEMLRLGAHACSTGEPLQLPPRILDVHDTPTSQPAPRASGSNPPHEDPRLDAPALRLEVLHLRQEASVLERQRDQSAAKLTAAARIRAERLGAQVKTFQHRAELQTRLHCATLFFDTDGQFTGDARIRHEYAAGRWTRLSFEIDGSHIRFDPTMRPAIVEIARIQIRATDGSASWVARTPKDFEAVRVKGGGRRLPHDSRLLVFAFGVNPQVVFPVLEASGTTRFSVRILLKASTSFADVVGFLRPMPPASVSG